MSTKAKGKSRGKKTRKLETSTPSPVAVAVAANQPEIFPEYPARPRIILRDREDDGGDNEKWWCRYMLFRMLPLVEAFYVWNAKRKFRKSLRTNVIDAYGFSPGWRERCLNAVEKWEGPGHPLPPEPRRAAA